MYSHLAVSAAIIFLLVAAIGPFLQQSIKSYTCQRSLHNASASIAATSWVDSGLALTSLTGNFHPNLRIMTAVLEAIIGLENNSRTVPFNCPTGNCDFSRYSSLGYCSSCIDITSRLQEQRGPISDELVQLHGAVHDESNTYTLDFTIPDEDCHLSLAMVDGKISSDTTTQLALCPSSRFGHFNFITLSLIWSDCSHDHGDGLQDRPGCRVHPQQLSSLGNSSGVIAFSCTLGLCVRDYTGRIRNGVLDETMTNNFPSSFQMNDYEIAILNLPCIIDSIKYDRSNLSQVPSVPGRKFSTVVLNGQPVRTPLECVSKVEPTVPWVIKNSLQQVFVSPGFGGPSCSLGWDRRGYWSESSGCDPWYLDPIFRGGKPTAETISSDMGRIAAAITNLMRAIGSNVYRNGSGVALGTVIQTTVCMRVDWSWLLLPAMLMLLTVILFLTVILMARDHHDGQPIWKSSAVVAFFHRINVRSHTPDRMDGGNTGSVVSAHERGEEHRDLMTLKNMKARAKEVMVKSDMTTGQRGFFNVSEEEDHHLNIFNKPDSQQRPADWHHDGETLLLNQLESYDSVRGHTLTFLQVDLGIGLTPSIHGSLSSSTQLDCEQES